MMNRLKLFSSLVALSALSYLTAGDLTALPENGWENNSSRIASNDMSQTSKRKAEEPSKPNAYGRFYIDVGAVYLRPYQGGTDFAQIVNSSDINTSNLIATQSPYGKNKALDFDFDWGVRGTLGYQLGKSRQTFRASYLYYQSDASESVSSDFVNTSAPFNQAVHSTDIDSGNSGIGDYVNSAKSHWNLHFNMLDLTFGKKYARGSCMFFEPFVGSKGIIFSESQKSSFMNDSNGQSGKLKQTVHFKGAGVMGGLNMDWVITKWLSLIGSIDGALLYSSIKTKRTSDDNIGTILWVGKNHDIKGVGLLEGSFGVRGVYCMDKGRYIDLKIGFEEHYLFQVMKHYILESDSTTDLSLMGWFATLGFEF